MDREELELFRASLRQACSSHSGKALDDALRTEMTKTINELKDRFKKEHQRQPALAGARS